MPRLAGYATTRESPSRWRCSARARRCPRDHLPHKLGTPAVYKDHVSTGIGKPSSLSANPSPAKIDTSHPLRIRKPPTLRANGISGLTHLLKLSPPGAADADADEPGAGGVPCDGDWDCWDVGWPSPAEVSTSIADLGKSALGLGNGDRGLPGQLWLSSIRCAAGHLRGRRDDQAGGLRANVEGSRQATEARHIHNGATH